MNPDLRGLLASGAFVVLVLGLAEALRRRGMDSRDTRKVVHIAVGLWIVPTFLLFDTRIWAVAPPALFVVFNALSLRFRWLRSTEGEPRSLGTVFYPFSVALLLFVAWGTVYAAAAAAAVWVMALGDAAASLVGRRWGRHLYHVRGHPRSWEGSAAMLVVSVMAIVAAFAALGQPLPSTLWVAAAAAAVVATGFEAVSLWGMDNLLVPMASFATLALLHGRFWG